MSITEKIRIGSIFNLMKIGIAQQDYIIGDFQGNFQKIVQAIDQAFLSKLDLIIFPEMAICGYPSNDLLYYSSFIDSSLESVNKITEYAKNKIAIIIGGIHRNIEGENSLLYNVAYFISNGEIQIVQKNLFTHSKDELRYFNIGEGHTHIYFQGKTISIQIGEINNSTLEKNLSDIDLIVNLTSVSYAHDLIEIQQKRILQYAEQFKVPIIHCNSIGAQGEVVLKGGSFISNSQGQLVLEMKYFEEDFAHFDLNRIEESIAIESQITSNQISFIHQALISGIKGFFAKSGFKKAVLGLSGGVDSALVLALAAEALGAENILSVLLPSQYSSDHSIDDSLALVKNLGSPHITIPIQSTFNNFEENLSPYFAGLAPNVTEENLQSRIRAVYLMALSNKLENILLNTSNKSEAAVGYGTLYGDMCGSLGVIGDLYKTQVYALCRYINRDGEIIPKNIITKAPSAELRPDQKDSDSLPEYDILDTILYQHLELNKSFSEIVEQGYEPTLVTRILKLIQNSEFKRFQAVPFIKVSSLSFSSGRNIPLIKKGL